MFFLVFCRFCLLAAFLSYSNSYSKPIQKLFFQFTGRFCFLAAFFSHRKSNSTFIGQLIFRVCLTMTSRWHKHLQMWNFIRFLQKRWHRHCSTKPLRFPRFCKILLFSRFLFLWKFSSEIHWKIVFPIFSQIVIFDCLFFLFKFQLKTYSKIVSLAFCKVLVFGCFVFLFSIKLLFNFFPAYCKFCL